MDGRIPDNLLPQLHGKPDHMNSDPLVIIIQSFYEFFYHQITLL